MNKAIYYIGLADKDDKQVHITIGDAEKKVQDTIGDCTIHTATGLYHHINGARVTEPTLVVIKFDANSKKYHINNCKLLKHIFNQEAILLEYVADIDSEFA